MTGVSVADYVRNPSGLFKDLFREIPHCVHFVFYLCLFKTLPLSRYSAGVFIFVPALFPHPILKSSKGGEDGGLSINPRNFVSVILIS